MGASSPLLLLLLLLPLFLASAGPSLAAPVGAARGLLVGGYQPIGDVNDPHVKEIGQYAVAEHNRQSGQSLAFVRVVSGRQQVVAGTNYDLVIDARGGGGGAPGEYEAVVYERVWEKYRSLTSFKPAA